MGYFDGMTGSLIRTGADGAKYYAPFGKLGRIYCIPDEETSARVQARWRGFYYVLFAGMMVAVWITGGDWRLIGLAPIAGLLAIPYGFVVARGLEQAPISFTDLPRVTRAEALTAYSRATGRRTLGLVLGASVLMTGLGIVTAVISRTPSLWLSAGFFFFCSVMIYRVYSRAQ